ncbi:GNAT family N-acetyltransferase [Herbiconiux liukaitaii]|uniref:GNAT family N-acetyltransferase n=1 Tax=Herbiconiux liukaitaii TaxID=3342799 RepID=UPI0035BB04C1
MTQIRALGYRSPWSTSARVAHSDGPTVPLRTKVRDALASAGVRRPRVLRGPRTEMPFDAPTLSTEQLELRPHRIDDAEDWYDLQSDPSVTQFLPWPERDRRASRRHLRDRTKHTRLWQADDFLALAVVREGRVIGDVSLHLRSVDADSRDVEIGWVMHPAHSGHGFATEAAAALLRFAFDTVGAQTVTAVTDARNTRSVALAKRLGFAEVQRGKHGSPESVLVLHRH